ncbi:MAG: YkgJ family cysteine cluster protein [Verrucomicrobiota bacterium]
MSTAAPEKSRIFWKCQRCTACCRWPGDVKVDEREIRGIAEFLGMEEEDFIQRHTRLRTDRAGLSLLEKPNDECIFLEGNDCVINAVKPQQCRDFPNKWNFPGWRQVCDAIPITLPAGKESDI